MGNVFRLYGVTYKDAIPLGYGVDNAIGATYGTDIRLSYQISRLTSGMTIGDPDTKSVSNPKGVRWHGFGLLYAAKLMGPLESPDYPVNANTQGRLFYCPSQNNNFHGYNTPDNPWPPLTKPSGTRSSYWCRQQDLGRLGQGMLWGMRNDIPSGASSPFAPWDVGTAGSTLPTEMTGTFPRAAVFPTIARMKNQGIVSDLFYNYDRINGGHGKISFRADGVTAGGVINVLYANGAAKSVPLSMLPRNDFDLIATNASVLGNDALRRVWFAIDKF